MLRIKVRWYVALLWLALTGTQALAQTPTEMHVAHVEGKVSLPNAQPIKLGQTIKETDILTFANKSGKLILWDEAHGLQVLHPTDKASEHGGGLQGEAKSFVTAKMLPSTAQHLEHFSNTRQLKAHFEGRKYLVLGKTWLIADAPFKAHGDTVLIIKYRNISKNYQSSMPVGGNGDTLALDPASLLKLGNEPISPALVSDYRIWWYCLSTKKFDEITYFDFVFADEKQVSAEIQQMLGWIADKSVAEKRAAAREFVRLAFGEPDEHNFERWMAMHFPSLK